MPAVDAFVGEGLNPSPYKEALERIAELEAERDHWREARRMAIAGGDMLKAQLDEARAVQGELRADIAMLQRQTLAIPDLVAERDALKADAERYRWLRDKHWLCGADVEAAIDAARTEGKG